MQQFVEKGEIKLDETGEFVFTGTMPEASREGLHIRRFAVAQPERWLVCSSAGKPEFSPIVVAALIVGGVTTGAILLNSGIVASEEAFQARA